MTLITEAAIACRVAMIGEDEHVTHFEGNLNAMPCVNMYSVRVVMIGESDYITHFGGI